MTFRFKKLLAILFFAGICTGLFSQEELINEETLDSEELLEIPDEEDVIITPMELLRNFLFEAGRYALNEVCENQEAVNSADLSQQGALFFLIPFWDVQEGKSVLLYEKWFPEKKEFIQADKVDKNKFNQILEFFKVHIRDTSDSNILKELDNRDDVTVIEDIGEEPVEVYNILKEGSLRRFTYDGEIFTVSSEKDMIRLTKVSPDKICRKFFTQDYKLLKTENYNNPKSSLELTLSSDIEYFYDETSNVLSGYEKNDRLGKTKTVVKLNPSGKVLRHDVWDIIETPVKDEDNNSDKVDIQKQESSSTVYEYDNENRLVLLTEKVYSWKPDKRGNKQKSETQSQHKFVYSENKESPDEYFYEDKKLRIKKVYNDDTSCSETLYFDDDFSVRADYKNGMKVLEVFYAGNKELRRRSFEN